MAYSSPAAATDGFAAALVARDSANRVRPKGSFTSYHKPIRIESYSPTHSVREEQTSASSLPSKDMRETAASAIGMALGSPTHPPDHITTSSHGTFVATVTTTVEAENANKVELSRTKSQKWAIFAKARSKTARNQNAMYYQSNSTPSSPGSPLLSSYIYGGSEKLKYEGALSSQGSPLSSAGNRSFLNKLQTKSTSSGPAKSPIPSISRAHAVSPSVKHVGGQSYRSRRDIWEPAQTSPSSIHSVPRLNVDIPNMSMERYSVMFGGLLENRSTESILARRQAPRDRLNVISESEAPAQYSVTSNISPAVLMTGTAIPRLPLTPPRMDASPRLSPHQRSNIGSAMPPSPSSAILELESIRHISTSYLPGTNKEDAEASPTPGERPRLISRFHRRAFSDQTTPTDPTMGGTSSSNEHSRMRTENMAQENKRNILPRTWNTMHPPGSDTNPQSVPQTADANSRLDCWERNGNDADEELDSLSQDPVQVSIARQISVSRQQRAMLGPLQRPG